MAATSAAVAGPIDSINAGGNPAPTTWAAVDVGWFYTPTFSYTLTGIGTKFGSSDTRVVTAEIFSGAPGSLSLLSSGGLTPVANTFVDANIGSVALSAGTTYFVALEHVNGLGVDVTEDAGATNLPGGLLFDFAGDNSFNFGPETGFTAQPILEFEGSLPADVPEPGTVALLGAGLAGLAWMRRRKRV